jgi:hypothetical protein
VILVAVVGLAAIAIVALASRPDGGSSVSTGSPPGFDDQGRTLDTTPFDLAQPRSTGSTTLPFVPGASATPTTPEGSPTGATTTTDLPAVDLADERCLLAFDVVQGLRAMTNPDGSLPENLALGADRLTAAADRIDRIGGEGAATVSALLREVAASVRGAVSVGEATRAYERFSDADDPVVAAYADGIATHLATSCPDILTVEP